MAGVPSRTADALSSHVLTRNGACKLQHARKVDLAFTVPSARSTSNATCESRQGPRLGLGQAHLLHPSDKKLRRSSASQQLQASRNVCEVCCRLPCLCSAAVLRLRTQHKSRPIIASTKLVCKDLEQLRTSLARVAKHIPVLPYNCSIVDVTCPESAAGTQLSAHCSASNRSI